MSDAPLAEHRDLQLQLRSFSARCHRQRAQPDGPHLEVIVVDDGSTTMSRAIISLLATASCRPERERRTRHRRQRRFRGVARRHRLFSRCRRRAVSPPRWSRPLTRFRDPAVAKVHWPLAIVDEDGRRTGKLLPARRCRTATSERTSSRMDRRLPDAADIRQRLVAAISESGVSADAARESRRHVTIGCRCSRRCSSAGRALECQGAFPRARGNNYWGRALEELALTVATMTAAATC